MPGPDDARAAGYTDDEILAHLGKGREVEVQSALKSGYTAKEIIDHLSGVKPTISPETQANDPNNWFPEITNAARGFGSGVASTAKGLYNLTKKGVSAVGLGELPEPPEALSKAASSEGEGAAFQVGRGLEQMGEFFLPGGAVSKGVKAVERFGPVARVGARALGEAASAAGVTAAQTGGDVDAMEKAAITAGLFSGGAATLGEILKKIPVVSIYKSKLKFPERFQGERAEDILHKAIDEGILISKGGADKIRAIESLETGTRDALIGQLHGQLVPMSVVEAPIMRFRQMAEGLGETGIVSQIDRRLAAFKRANGAVPGKAAQTVTSPILGPTGASITHTIPAVPERPAMITVDAAQQAKNDFQAIAAQAFGKLQTGQGQLRKLMSTGLKESIEALNPAIKEANKNIQDSKLLRNAIDHYVNSSTEGLNPKMLLLMLWNKPLGLTYGALQNPLVRSALAIITDRVAKSTTGNVVGKLAGAAAPSILSPIPEAPQ